MNKQLNTFFKPEDVIYTYSSNQAVNDGFLFDLDRLSFRKLCPSRVSQVPLKYVTTNLMAEGYINKDQTVNLPNIMDLLTQANIIFSKKPAEDYFISGRIELPNGSRQEIYISQNETGRYTVMLPEDY